MDITNVLTSVISSGGALIVIANLWMFKRSERSQKDAGKRISDREPLVLKGVELQNTGKVVQILQQGIDFLEDSNKRAAEEFRESHGRLEDTVESLKDENGRIRAVFSKDVEEYKNKVFDLMNEILRLQEEIRILKKNNDKDNFL